MSGPTDVKPALTAPEEESIGPRDLTHWRTRVGARLVGLVNHVIGAYARWTLAVIAAVGGLAAVITTALAAQVYDAHPGQPRRRGHGVALALSHPTGPGARGGGRVTCDDDGGQTSHRAVASTP